MVVSHQGTRMLPQRSAWSLGIDPGVSGGICLLSPERAIVHLTSSPDSVRGMWLYLRTCLLPDAGRSRTPIRAAIEQLTGYQQGRYAPRQSSIATMMTNYGAWQGILTALDVPHTLPSPQKWTSGIGIEKVKDEDYATRKKRLCAFARELYPDEPRITLKTCDALLIARYVSTL